MSFLLFLSSTTGHFLPLLKKAEFHTERLLLYDLKPKKPQSRTVDIYYKCELAPLASIFPLFFLKIGAILSSVGLKICSRVFVFL